MKTFCDKSEKFVDVWDGIPDWVMGALPTCPECGLLDSKEKSDSHAHGIPDWFVKYIEELLDSRQDNRQHYRRDCLGGPNAN